MPVAKPLHSLSVRFCFCSSMVGSLKASLYKTVFQGRFFVCLLLSAGAKGPVLQPPLSSLPLAWVAMHPSALLP